METLFLGRPASYWLELNKLPRELTVEHLIEEIAQLRGKVSFYEARIHEMHNLFNSKD